MGGYKLVMGVLAIIIASFLWIPLNYAVELTLPLINSGITEASVIQNNTIAAQGFYYCLFFIILAVVLYVIKTSKEEEEQGEVVYVPQY